jgi:hypothetical protein
MKNRLSAFSLAALASLIGVSVWATAQIGIVPAIRELWTGPEAGFNPWFIATLTDAYFGFLWFWAWIAYKETSNAVRALWLLLILALGNIAMAAYMLIQLWKLPADAPAEALLLRRA